MPRRPSAARPKWSRTSLTTRRTAWLAGCAREPPAPATSGVPVPAGSGAGCRGSASTRAPGRWLPSQARHRARASKFYTAHHSYIAGDSKEKLAGSRPAAGSDASRSHRRHFQRQLQRIVLPTTLELLNFRPVRRWRLAAVPPRIPQKPGGSARLPRPAAVACGFRLQPPDRLTPEPGDRRGKRVLTTDITAT